MLFPSFDRSTPRCLVRPAFYFTNSRRDWLFALTTFLRPAVFAFPALAHHRRIPRDISRSSSTRSTEKHGATNPPRRQSFLRLRTTNLFSRGQLDRIRIAIFTGKEAVYIIFHHKRRYDGGDARTRALELLEGYFHLPFDHSPRLVWQPAKITRRTRRRSRAGCLV